MYRKGDCCCKNQATTPYQNETPIAEFLPFLSKSLDSIKTFSGNLDHTLITKEKFQIMLPCCLRYNRSSFSYVCEDNGKLRTDGKLIETTNSGKFLGII